MSMIGNYRRISQVELANLRANPGSISKFLYPGDDSRGSKDCHLNIDKAWHAIHFLLCGDAWEGEPPYYNAVFGGTPLGDEDVGYGPARFLTPDEVKETSAALDDLLAEDMLDRLDAEAMVEAEIYSFSGGAGGAEDKDYIGSYYQALVEFFGKAARHGDAMLIYLN